MIIENLYPLISCICITDNRTDFLLRAIFYFNSQNYPNRELIISHPKNDSGSKTLLKNMKQLSGSNVIVLERENNISLGKARNHAVENSNGQYICTWDDDDWHRNYRLLYQYTSLISGKQKRDACLITNIILYENTKNRAYIPKAYNWGGTILCKRDLVMKYPYIDSNLGEDHHLIQNLISGKYLHYSKNYGLYAFIYHGENILNNQEITYLLNDCPKLDLESTYWLKDQLFRKVNLTLT